MKNNHVIIWWSKSKNPEDILNVVQTPKGFMLVERDYFGSVVYKRPYSNLYRITIEPFQGPPKRKREMMRVKLSKEDA